MLKTLLSTLSPRKPIPTLRGPDFAPSALKSLIQFFPMGKKLHYYPEFERDFKLESVIIAYRVNQHYLYSHDSILCNKEGTPTGFRLQGKKILPLEGLKTLQFLLPDTSEMELKLNYFTRAKLGRGGQFAQGNIITLVANKREPGVPTIDTRVDRRQVIQDGPYADYKTILVTPDVDSLHVADQRQTHRVDTAIWAILKFRGGNEFPCVLGDFSERSLRLQVEHANDRMPLVATKDRVEIEFNLHDNSLRRFRGTVYRRTNTICVVEIDAMFKYDSYKKMNQMDVIEIKTGLLNMNA